MRRATALLRRYWWLVLAALLGIVWAFSRRRSDRVGDGVADLLRRAHAADVDAELAKRKLDAEAEAEVRQIRDSLKTDLQQSELEEIDDRAKLAKDPDELLRYYRGRAREEGIRHRWLGP